MPPSADKPTLDRLVREHLPAALRFAVRLTGDLHEAEEVVQEALARAARGWDTFRGQAQFRTWLLRIVINASRDRAARARPAEALPPDLCDPRAAAPVEQVLAGELKERIAACVAALPPRQREVLALVVYEELTPRETAEVLQMTEDNVHATLHVARRRLRRQLAAWLAEK
jgi:RNA polymerase sigma-70 factor (ECF subfamily)